MVHGRTQVLAERKNIDAGGAQIVHAFADLGVGLAQPQHQAALGEHRRAMALGVREYRQGALVAGARIAHRVRQAAHGLDVLREHLEP